MSTQTMPPDGRLISLCGDLGVQREQVRALLDQRTTIQREQETEAELQELLHIQTRIERCIVKQLPPKTKEGARVIACAGVLGHLFLG